MMVSSPRSGASRSCAAATSGERISRCSARGVDAGRVGAHADLAPIGQYAPRAARVDRRRRGTRRSTPGTSARPCGVCRPTTSAPSIPRRIVSRQRCGNQPQHGWIGKRDVREVQDRRVREVLAQQARQRIQVVVLDQERARAAARAGRSPRPAARSPRGSAPRPGGARSRGTRSRPLPMTWCCSIHSTSLLIWP